jgi:hypothetical protein
MLLQNNIVLVFLLLISGAGIVSHGKFNYFPKLSTRIETPFIYGMIIMLQSIFGLSGLTETPSRIDKLMNQKWFKFFTIMVLSYAATRDIEDSIFLMLMFLVAIQLIRTKEERKKNPYIL